MFTHSLHIQIQVKEKDSLLDLPHVCLFVLPLKKLYFTLAYKYLSCV